MIKLIGHDSEENAYIVNDYPYGFRLRCKIKYWVETKKGQGQRFCSQTLNPKTDKWNKPKKGTYHVILGMFINEEGYVTHETLSSGGWSKEEDIKRFEELFSPLTEYQQGAIRYIRATNKANEVVKWTIKEGEGQQQTKEEQQAIWNKAVSWGYSQIK